MKIGIVKDTVYNDSEGYFLFRMVDEINKKKKDTVTVFADTLLAPDTGFVVTSKRFVSFFDGVLIADTLKNANIISVTPQAKRKILYLRDPEWMTDKAFFNQQLDIIYNKSIELYAPSVWRMNVYKKMFNKPVGLLTNWSSKELEKIIHETND